MTSPISVRVSSSPIRWESSPIATRYSTSTTERNPYAKRRTIRAEKRRKVSLTIVRRADVSSASTSKKAAARDARPLRAGRPLSSEVVVHSRVDEPSIHAERRISRIDKNAGAADLLRSIGNSGVEILPRKFVEESFRADGKRVFAPAIRHLEVGQPCRRINLIVLHSVIDAAVFAVASLSRREGHRALAEALHETRVVPRLAAGDRPSLKMIEENGAEAGELRRSGLEAGDARFVVAVCRGEIDPAAQQRTLMIDHEVVPICARVDRVGEEARAVGSERRQDRLHLWLREVSG